MTIQAASQKDLAIVERLLESEKLPTDIIAESKGELWVIKKDDHVLGSGALEFYGSDALLRSVVVAEESKGEGYGSRIIEHLEQEAAQRGVGTLWLLTETAEGFFGKRGYQAVERNVIVNAGILDSSEFKHLCASTAVCMKKDVKAESTHQ